MAVLPVHMYCLSCRLCCLCYLLYRLYRCPAWATVPSLQQRQLQVLVLGSLPAAGVQGVEHLHLLLVPHMRPHCY